jgi:hypothetical protein
MRNRVGSRFHLRQFLARLRIPDACAVDGQRISIGLCAAASLASGEAA